MNEEYNSFKIIHHPEVIEQLRGGIQPNPIHVQMMISDFCNQDCSFCSYRMSGYPANKWFHEGENNNPRRMISKDKCFEILNDCKEMGVKAIEYTGGGEPTVHSDHIDIFRKTLDNNLDLALVSNGVIFRKGLIENLLFGKWVRFSVDAADENKYSEIRRVDRSVFKKVVHNIEKLVCSKSKSNSDLTIGISFVVTKENFNQIYDAVKLYKNLGVDNVRIGAIFTNDDYDYHKDYYNHSRDLVEKSKSDFESENFKVINLFSERISDMKLKSPDYDFCGEMNVNTIIGGDLNIYRCCLTAYNPRGFIGSIKNKRFKELWESEEKKENFINFNARDCIRCAFNGKNIFINYMIEESPRHVNYA